ncbi:MAG TPA: hypothetical protein VGE38_08590 [Nocardioides sp.]|uniref:hypothetical protein n=1 Tax=Nocardioides sp. TaxID=35761 RepID=UPI002ED7A6B0
MPARIEGLRETVRELQALGVDVNELKDAMARIAARATSVMQGFIPARTGRLRASARGNRAKGKAVVTVGRATVPYAAPINYGWPERNIAPASFTAQTDAVMATEAAAMLDDEISVLIRKNGLD